MSAADDSDGRHVHGLLRTQVGLRSPARRGARSAEF
jgi:hypothetical protein